MQTEGKLIAMRDILSLLRPKQYTKNLFVLVPIFFAGEIFNTVYLAPAFVTMALFCCLASAVYILNDCVDVTHDRNHPVKKKRPIAAGKVNPNLGLVIGLLLALFAISGGFVLDRNIGLIMSTYAILNVAYSLALKKIAIVDVLIIALGFVLRLQAGSAATDTELSMWIILLTFLLALFLAVAKRLDDVFLERATAEKLRVATAGYNEQFITSLLSLLSTLIIICYVMYVSSPATMQQWGSNNLYLSSFFLVASMMRYLQITLVKEGSGDPSQVLLKDHFIQINLLAFTAFYAALIYLN